MDLRATGLTLVGIPVMVAIVVGSPLLWWDARTNFGLQANETLGFAVATTLSATGVFVAFRAYMRVRLGREAGRHHPRILHRLFPLQVLLGAAFAVFFAHEIHEQRTSSHAYFATKYCAELLCPVSEDDYLAVDDCAPAQPGTACFEAARDCQRENAAVAFEERSKAELHCLRERVSLP